jgi:hypothetical protein
VEALSGSDSQAQSRAARAAFSSLERKAASFAAVERLGEL